MNIDQVRINIRMLLIAVMAAVFLAALQLQFINNKAAATGGDQTIQNVGFQTPESVLYDEKSDRYLVSNINGPALLKDDNGFISKLSPNGAVENLKWIDGTSTGFTLNGPKGMAISKGRLFVADIDSVRVFDAGSGAYINSYAISGAGFLNDVVAAPNGDIYVTDSGIAGSPLPIGNDAIYKISGQNVTKIAGGLELSQPNGLEFHGQTITMVPLGSDKVFELPANGGALVTKATMPAGSLDGVVRLDDGTLFVSSWNGSAVYKLAPDGTITTEVSNVVSPADIGFDSLRNRILIPVFLLDKVVIHPIQ